MKKTEEAFDSSCPHAHDARYRGCPGGEAPFGGCHYPWKCIRWVKAAEKEAELKRQAAAARAARAEAKPKKTSKKKTSKKARNFLD